MNTTERPSVPQLLALSTQICKKNLKARNQITPTKYCLGRPGFPAHSQHSLHVMSPYYDCLFHFFLYFVIRGRNKEVERREYTRLGLHRKPLMQFLARPPLSLCCRFFRITGTSSLKLLKITKSIKACWAL